MECIKFSAALSLAELIVRVSGVLGRGACLDHQRGAVVPEKVVGVSDGRKAAPDTLCFVERAPAPEGLVQLQRALVIANAESAGELYGCTVIVVQDPRAVFIDMLESLRLAPGFLSFSSKIGANPTVDADASIHPQAVVEGGVHVGAGTTIGAGCVIKRGTYLGCNVTVRENTVIGCDGIALYKAKDGRVLRFPHLAGVIIEDGVEIGAACVLPRGVLRSSHIGSDSVIGNLSNLGHAVQIGRKVWMSVGCMIGGNTTIEDGCTLGLSVSVRDNLHVGRNCSIGMGSAVVKSLPDGSSVFGNPARRLPDVNAGPDR